MRIGLMIGSDKERTRAERVAGLIDDARAADRAGFASLWLPQIPGYLDAMTAIAAIGRVTERIELGTSVCPSRRGTPSPWRSKRSPPRPCAAAASRSASARRITGSSRTSSGCPMSGPPR
jgi:hypothetical protein